MKTKYVIKIPKPLDRLVYWINERESIRLKKEAKQPRPWTDDEILDKYRFCNVCRIEDKVSQWLLKNWYPSNTGKVVGTSEMRLMFIRAVLARQLNNPDSLREIGTLFDWKPKEVLSVLRSRAERGLKNFNAAYIVTGSLGWKPGIASMGVPKIEQVVNLVVTPIWNSLPAYNLVSLRETWESLLPYAGFSSFMAGQVVADLRLVIRGSGYWLDCNEWAPVGPGSRRGMNRLLGKDVKAPMNQKEFQEKLIILRSTLQKRIVPSRFDRMEAMDIQNCLCEFDKYERVLWSQGRPKRYYTPSMEIE